MTSFCAFWCSDLCFLCSVSVSLCKAVCRRSAALAGVLAIAFALTPTLGQQPVASQQELVNKYCVTCHNEKTKTGGLVLEKLDADHPAADSETWEKVIRKLRAGLMPPTGTARPERAALENFRATLETAIDRAALAKSNPGVTALHRLNRNEYANAVRGC